MGIAVHKKVIAGVLAAAVLVTGLGAGAAQAGSRDTERALAALLGLAVIGAIVADHERDKRRDRARERVSRGGAVYVEPRPLPRRVSKRALPEQCLRVIHTNRGKARFFAQRCMLRNYDFVDRLPRNCERQIRTDRGMRFGWGARCLRQNGFRVAGR